ncbi:cyclic nucleotide-binding domain-containing protein [Sphingomonas sp. CFBP 8760]|uniref:cyclic nucleotide-binding domain-containing protein n=1 Tax=Sphingomonas sp. CFBP 8760 TaxID=2775282 RepID=UPI00406D27B5
MRLQAMVRQLGRHAKLSDDDRRAVDEPPFVRRTMKMGEHLARKGDPTHEHLVLLSGYVHKYKVASDGGRQIVAIRMPGDAI